jgi:hypothetical protein
MNASSLGLPQRMRAALIHLALSLGVAALAAGLVFFVWYPLPFREISGGRDLFLILVGVDVVIGPLITLMVFDLRKSRNELVRDLAVVGVMQLAALGYGIHTMALARPVVIALEGDRLRVVRAIDLAEADLSAAPPELRTVPWSGPVWLATRAPTASEKFETMNRGLAGEDIGMRPEFWLPDGARGAAYVRAAQPLDKLVRLSGERAAVVEQAVRDTGRPRTRIGYLPILARSTDWSALVDRKDGEVIGYVPVDGF